MDFLKRANELYEDTVADRRYMHTNAEAKPIKKRSRSDRKARLIFTTPPSWPPYARPCASRRCGRADWRRTRRPSV